MTRDLLAIYLQDHHAAGSAGCRLAARAARGVSADLDGRDELPRVAQEIAADLETLEEIMGAEGVSPSVVKDHLAIAAGELGRLKLNGRLRTRSPLSDVIELETLLIGISGKAALWRTLDLHKANSTHDYHGLVRRAEEQLVCVSRCRDSAAMNAFRACLTPRNARTFS